MKTSIDIDDQLFEQLCRLTKTHKKGQAIRMAVESYVKQHTGQALIELLEKGDIFDKDYDYKAWRRKDAA